MPPGHLPVRSYLAVPVKGVAGDVLGGLFFGHSEVGVFTEQHERLALGVAAWASVALENARLYKEAQAANRMKDEFLAVLSHELRTPLNAIVGYSRLLRGGILSGDKATRGLETLERNATWLTQIVEDVLDVSRIVSGKIRLDVQPVELPLIVDNAVATRSARRRRQRCAHSDDRRSARGAGIWRSGPSAAGRLEPGVQCGEVHAEERPRAGAAGTRELTRRDCRQRYRDRDSAGFPAVCVRAVSSGRRGHDAKDRRSGTRPRHRASHRRNARRHGRCLQRRRGQGSDISRPAAR